jgi:hypothetical protein
MKTSIRLIRVASDASRAISVSADGSLQLWEVKSGAQIHKMRGHQAPVTEAAFVPDGSAIVSSSEDRSVRVWDVSTGTEIASFFADSPIATCTVACDPPVIIAGDKFGRTYFLRIEGLPAAEGAKPHNVSRAPNKRRESARPVQRKFDVFLCHNSVDKPRVKQVHEQLKSRGIRCWLDDEQIRPGTDWIDTLQKKIFDIRSAAVFVGRDGMGPWQLREVNALLNKFVKIGSTLIPVILEDCDCEPNVPLFLDSLHRVDFRVASPDPLEQLLWGITGKRAFGN